MNGAKIQLSAEESELVRNADWVLTKNNIIQKVYALFGMISEQMQTTLSAHQLPDNIANTSPKIARGENYSGLPYVMLDYPRLFSSDNVFAIRSFFWWGNYFSITLHLKGSYTAWAADQVKNNFEMLKSSGFYLATSSDEWQHDLHQEHYTALADLTPTAFDWLLAAQPFIKLSARLSLAEWNMATAFFQTRFDLLINLLPH